MLPISTHNALTIDVEDYYQVSAFEHVVSYSEWGNYQSRVTTNTLKILNLLDESGTKATFFILGWIAEKFPEIVRQIKEKGHEIASHGYKHSIIYNFTPEEFRNDLRKSKSILENLVGVKIKGYRAPSFSITHNSIWALEILSEEGFEYDSSVFPIYHDRYGIPSARFHPYKIYLNNGKTIFEFPPLTYRFFGKNLPLGGGGYMRLLPVRLMIWQLKRINLCNIPGVIYFHPWELDPNQPFIDSGSKLTNLRHKIGLKKMEEKIIKLLKHINFSSIDFIINNYSFNDKVNIAGLLSNNSHKKLINL